ncbi:hypothetical protein RhiirA5_435709 [Rhizophagus irregularis]|nr:hypothetical protein RhiirA5_435709 [Rhizophagus irregularis]
MTVKCIIYILLSYVITIDAEIVHVIEGKGQQNGSSTKTVKSIQSTDDHISSTLSSSDQTHSQIIDNDKIIVVSMKKLSFFECASTVLKNEDENDENHGDDEIKDDDEIKVDDESNDDDQKINDTLKESSNMEIIIH